MQQKLEEVTKIKVRMGQNPHSLNIMISEINRMEYIEVFSLLASAAERIEQGVTCVELNKYDSPTFEGSIPRQTERIEDQKIGSEKPVKSPKTKSSRLKKWADKLSSLMSEDDGNDDEQ